MKVKDVIEKFTIKHNDSFWNSLTLTKEIHINTMTYKGCYNCGDKINQHLYHSAPWTNVQHCWKCNHINLIFVSDRMGGCKEDVIKCYTDGK